MPGHPARDPTGREAWDRTAIDAEVVAWVPAAWPVDGEHPAEPLSEDLDVAPSELDDASDDAVVSARALTDAREAAEHCRLRERVYLSAAAPRFAGRAIVRPLRAAAPALAGGSSLTIKIRAEGGASAGRVWVQIGRGSPMAVYQQRAGAHIRSVEVPALAAEAVYELAMTLRATRVVPSPDRYPGFGWLAVLATPEARLLSVSMWGR